MNYLPAAKPWEPVERATGPGKCLVYSGERMNAISLIPRKDTPYEKIPPLQSPEDLTTADFINIYSDNNAN